MLLLLWLWSGTAQAVGRSCAAVSRWWLFKELLHRCNPALRVMTIKPPLLLWKQHINQGHAWLASIRLCVSVFACVCVCVFSSPLYHFITAEKSPIQSCFLGGGRQRKWTDVPLKYNIVFDVFDVPLFSSWLPERLQWVHGLDKVKWRIPCIWNSQPSTGTRWKSSARAVTMSDFHYTWPE